MPYPQGTYGPRVGDVVYTDPREGACGLKSPFPTGQLLSFDIGDQPVFEIPLSNVSQCTTGKNEVTLEFHQNDDAEVSLMEVRFYVPPTQEDGVDPVEVRPPWSPWEEMVPRGPWLVQEQDPATP